MRGKVLARETLAGRLFYSPNPNPFSFGSGGPYSGLNFYPVLPRQKPEALLTALSCLNWQALKRLLPMLVSQRCAHGAELRPGHRPDEAISGLPYFLNRSLRASASSSCAVIFLPSALLRSVARSCSSHFKHSALCSLYLPRCLSINPGSSTRGLSGGERERM